MVIGKTSKATNKNTKINKEHAAALGRIGGKRGGPARAANMDKDRRSEIASKAAKARWRGDAAPVEASHAGTIKLGDLELVCANLPDGSRVIAESTLMGALARGYSGFYSERDASADPGDILPRYVAPAMLREFIPDDLKAMLAKPIPTKLPSGAIAKAIDALAIPKICEVWLKARDAGKLVGPQLVTANRAEIIVRGLATVGIVALVDEATGYQDARTRDALAKILEEFVAKELQPWVPTFPPEFYKEMFRLRDWSFSPETTARPGVVGKYTNDLVYDRLAPGVRGEILRTIPRNDEGKPKGALFRMLTPNHGHPKLKEHLAALIVLMRASDTWESFKAAVNRALPRYPEVIEPSSSADNEDA